MSIFPSLNTDINQSIVLFCDVGSLIRLSGTHKEAYKVLSNDHFFKELFENRYPHLHSCDKLFGELRAYNPSICFKIMCVMPESPYKSNWPKSFSDEAISQIELSLKSKKEELEKSIIKFQGSDSPIVMAESKVNLWKEEYQVLLAEYHHACQQRQKELLEMTEPVKDALSNSNPDLNEIVQNFLANGKDWNQFLQVLDEDLTDMGGPDLQNIAEFFIQLRNNYDTVNIKQEELLQLEDAQVELIDQQEDTERELQEINERLKPEHREALFSKYESTLSGRWKDARNLHRTFLEIPQLQSCSVYIQYLTDHFDEINLANYNKLSQMIEALPNETKKTLKKIGTAESEQRFHKLFQEQISQGNEIQHSYDTGMILEKEFSQSLIQMADRF